MDLHFNSTVPGTSKETMLVSLRYSPHDKDMIQLISFERTSIYAVYKTCCDAEKSIQLCICEQGRQYPLNIGSNLVNYHRISSLVSSTVTLVISKCVTVIQYNMETSQDSQSQGFSVYLSNVCATEAFNVRVNLKLEKDAIYSLLPVDGVLLHPGGVQFVGVMHYNSATIQKTLDMLQFSVDR